MNILKMEHISKAFGGAKALDDVSISVEKGEIHALLGENGAGKSTLMNILTGVVEADAGRIEFDGNTYVQPTIAQMEAAGIAFVHQELNVINDLTVYDNIFLRREIKGKFGLLDKKAMINETKDLFDRLGVDIDPVMRVSELKTSQKQLLEICRALYADAKLLILDEPTTALGNDEIDHLFGILENLKKEGKSFIFISHKMPEIFRISDSFTVFRNGKFISSGKIADTTPHKITCDMVGEKYAEEEVYEQRELGDVVLKLDHFSGSGFSNIDLEVHRGEIVAFTGLAGCGASELMQTMFGALPPEGGYITVEGKIITGQIHQFMKKKVAMLPANRKENSVIPDMNILENTYIAEQSISRNKPFISIKNETEKYLKLKDMLQIKAESEKDSINSLSGGNQQKIFLARWLNTDADVLLFDNPTQGVDVGAKAEIYRLILEFAQSGKTVIINTLEIPEIKKVADRCIVFYEGHISGTFTHNEIDEQTIMAYSTNAIGTMEASNHE